MEYRFIIYSIPHDEYGDAYDLNAREEATEVQENNYFKGERKALFAAGTVVGYNSSLVAIKDEYADKVTFAYSHDVSGEVETFDDAKALREYLKVHCNGTGLKGRI